MIKDEIIKYGWSYGWEYTHSISTEIRWRIMRFYSLLNGFGIHYGDFNLKEDDTDRSLFYLIQRNDTYIIHSNKIFRIKENFCYYDAEFDYSKIELVSEDLNDIIRLELISDQLLREKKLNDLLNIKKNSH